MLNTTGLWRPKHIRLFRVLTATNAGFAFAIVFIWTIASKIVSEPMAWATWHVIQRENAKSLLNYPLNMLWMLPIAAILAAWIAQRAHKERLAIGLLVLPMLLFSLTIATYHTLGLYNIR
jgi:hypothetical protein